MKGENIEMTNAEKYLKDGVNVEEFLNAIPRGEITAWLSNKGTCISMEGLKDWLKEQSKPTLSEDEKVILKNVDDKYETIGRDEDGLFIEYYFDEYENDCNYLCFNNLFKFIKLGEEYSIKELLGDDE